MNEEKIGEREKKCGVLRRKKKREGGRKDIERRKGEKIQRREGENDANNNKNCNFNAKLIISSLCEQYLK